MPRAGADAVLSTTATFKLSLHPSAVADRNTSLQGARELLDGMLMRHNDRLGGVLVSYEKPRLVDHADLRIVHMAGYVDVNVRAKVKVFTPKVGSKLKGRVNKIGVDHVGLLVHDDVLHLIGSMAEEGTGALDFLGGDGADARSAPAAKEETEKTKKKEKTEKKEKKAKKAKKEKKAKKAKREREENAEGSGKRRKKG